MNLQDNNIFNAKGLWEFTAYEGDLEYVLDEKTGLLRIANPIVWSEKKYNLITTAGKGVVLDRVFALGGLVEVSHTNIGTSPTAAAIGDTTLAGRVAKAFDALPIRTALAVVTITTFGTAEGNINIQEAALSSGAAGPLLNRLAPIGPFNKTSAVSLQIRTTISQT